MHEEIGIEVDHGFVDLETSLRKILIFVVRTRNRGKDDACRFVRLWCRRKSTVEH